MNNENKKPKTMLEDFINFSMITGASNNCRDCGGERKTIKFQQIPILMRPFFEEILKTEPYMNKKNDFVYCKKCDSISILSEYI